MRADQLAGLSEMGGIERVVRLPRAAIS